MSLNSGIMMFFMLLMACSASASESATALLRSAAEGVYAPATKLQLKQAETLFTACFLHRCEAANIQQGWQELGFDVITLAQPEGTVYAIREQAQQRTGRGFYLFRTSSPSTLVVQAPHAYKDKHTGKILLKLFMSGSIRAAAWNSVPRRQLQAGVAVDADMAHLQHSYFNAFSRAFSSTLKTGRLVQLHGFAQHKRRTNSAATAAIIISNGSKHPDVSLRQLDRCLKLTDLGSVLLYPEEVQELGATTNSQGHVLRGLGHRGFIHLEMSLPLRQSLLKQAPLRSKLLHCLES